MPATATTPEMQAAYNDGAIYQRDGLGMGCNPWRKTGDAREAAWDEGYTAAEDAGPTIAELLADARAAGVVEEVISVSPAGDPRPVVEAFAWVAEGEHPTAPGRKLSVHGSEAGAIKAACEFVAMILEDTPLADPPGAVVAENWEAVLERLQDYHGAAFCDVTVTRTPFRA